MKEIGSEFWTEKQNNGKGIQVYLPQSFHLFFSLCGRTALDIIIEDMLLDKRIQSVYMPSYCCHTMIEPFLKHGIEVQFYNVYFDTTGIKADYQDNPCELVFLIDYFGFLCEKTFSFAMSQKRKGKTIIYDLTHALFCSFDKEKYFDYVFGSFKKWLGVNAGFAAKKEEWRSFPPLYQNKRFVELRNTAFDLKAAYINNPKAAEKSIFLKRFQDAEELLETDYKYYGPDKKSIAILSSIEGDQLRKRRISNARILMEGLNKQEGLDIPFREIKENECPLFVPIKADNSRNALRSYLRDRDMYMPIHWPVSALHQLNSVSQSIYETEMSCVCDQRYDETDMNRIVDAISAFFQNTILR